jgi:hypothetical protein
LIVRVLEADAGPGAALYEHLVSRLDQLVNTRGYQSHAVLVHLDLLGHSDFHGIAPGVGVFETDESTPPFRENLAKTP